MVLFWKHGTSIPVDHHHVGRMKTAINWEAHIPFPDTHRSINSSWLYIPFIFLIAIPSYSYCCEFYIVLCPQFHRFHSKSHVHGSFFSFCYWVYHIIISFIIFISPMFMLVFFSFNSSFIIFRKYSSMTCTAEIIDSRTCAAVSVT